MCPPRSFSGARSWVVVLTVVKGSLCVQRRGAPRPARQQSEPGRGPEAQGGGAETPTTDRRQVDPA